MLYNVTNNKLLRPLTSFKARLKSNQRNDAQYDNHLAINILTAWLTNCPDFQHPTTVATNQNALTVT